MDRTSDPKWLKLKHAIATAGFGVAEVHNDKRADGRRHYKFRVFNRMIAFQSKAGDWSEALQKDSEDALSGEGAYVKLDTALRSVVPKATRCRHTITWTFQP